MKWSNFEQYLTWEEFLEATQDDLTQRLKQLFHVIDNWNESQIEKAIIQIDLTIFSTHLDHISRYINTKRTTINSVATIIYNAYKQWYAKQTFENFLSLEDGLSKLFHTSKNERKHIQDDIQEYLVKQQLKDTQTDNSNEIKNNRKITGNDGTTHKDTITKTTSTIDTKDLTLAIDNTLDITGTNKRDTNVENDLTLAIDRSETLKGKVSDVIDSTNTQNNTGTIEVEHDEKVNNQAFRGGNTPTPALRQAQYVTGAVANDITGTDTTTNDLTITDTLDRTDTKTTENTTTTSGADKNTGTITTTDTLTLGEKHSGSGTEKTTGTDTIEGTETTTNEGSGSIIKDDSIVDEGTNKLIGTTSSQANDAQIDEKYKNRYAVNDFDEDNLKAQHLKTIYDAMMDVQNGMRDFIQNTFSYLLLPVQSVNTNRLPWPWTYGDGYGY